jgi:hypothetical protein
MEIKSLEFIFSYINDLDDETTAGYIIRSRKMLYSGFFTDERLKNEEIKDRYTSVKNNQTKWHHEQKKLKSDVIKKPKKVKTRVFTG